MMLATENRIKLIKNRHVKNTCRYVRNIALGRSNTHSILSKSNINCHVQQAI